MEEHDLQTLELNKVLERLAGHASFSVSHEKALALRPATEMAEVLRRQAATHEARRLLDLKPNFSIGGARDIRSQVRRAAVGALLAPDELLLVVSTIASSRIVRGTMAKLGDQLPTLEEITLPIGTHDGLEQEIRRAINDAGEVVDSASPALAHVRLELRRAHERLMSKLNEIVTSPAYRQALQEPIVTQRGGRYVVPVKAEFKGQVKGIVHDQSASGATVFMEPLVVVDLANRWRQLQIDEEHEIERILRQLSGLVGRDAEALERTLEALAEVDLCLAKAKLAEAMRAESPRLVDLPSRGGDTGTLGLGEAGATHPVKVPPGTVTPLPGGEGGHGRPGPRTPGSGLGIRNPTEPCVRLVNARHPLLTGHVVPITVELGGDFDVLVITGPNTGGKTVALKTVGLLCLMAQCGLQIPAEQTSVVGVFRAVYADIGDEQSIEQSLSTFSSHVSRIVDILGKADERSLVLLDELGAGTDPQEGSALARSILSHLLARRIPTIATTHYSELKSFAHTTPRVENASVEFDLETLSPTYKLSIGLPGRSNALAIATRLGMGQAIIEGARELLQPADLEIEGLLAQLQTDREEARNARAEVERLRDQLRAQRARLNAELDDLHERKALILERAREQSEQELAALRQKMQQVVRELERIRVERDHAAPIADLVKQVEDLRPLRTSGRRRQRREPMDTHDLKVGQAVYLASLQTTGVVASLPDDRGEVEVQVGSLRTRVKTRDLWRTDQPQPLAPRSPDITYRFHQEAPDISIQLDLRGRRPPEAEEELDRYLNDAYLAGLKQVRIVHGKGTGALRQAVRQQLASSPLVRHFESAGDRDGGEGATVVSLAN
ncbi:MAG: endonuclease MutS2 [Sphingomonadaceae bacterium]